MKNTTYTVKKSSGKVITIDMVPDDPSDAKALSPENLIHGQQFELCTKLIEQQKVSAEYYKPEQEYLHYHNTISIIGSRGVGKTTFLLSIKKYYENKPTHDYALIDIIDPTVIEKKQHPFINILALIHKYVIENLNKTQLYQARREYQENFCDVSSRIPYQEWEKYYSDVLKALPYIDGIGKHSAYKDWDDSEYITERGIKVVEYFNQLEETFHRFIYYSLKVLEKKCFILLFDDIDTNFSKGYEVLETIRKYLSTPQIVVLLTGDLELYSNLIRQAQWKCFGKKYLKIETTYSQKEKEEFSKIINHLEDQYILKLFKPEYRLVLNSLGENLEADQNLQVNIKYFIDQPPKDIKKCYNDFVERLGFNNKNSQVNLIIVNRLLNLSIRTQLRILAFLKKKKEEDYFEKEAIINLFWSDLNQRGVDYKNLSRRDIISTIPTLNFLTYNKFLNNNFNFLPRSDNEIIDKSILAMNALCNYSFKKNPGLIIDYWIRICTLQFFLSQSNDVDQNELLKQSKVFSNDIDLPDMVAHLEICLNKKNIKSNKHGNKNLDNNIPGCISINYKEKLRVNNLPNLLFLLPLYNVEVKNQEEYTYYSLFRLFAIIGELLKIIYGLNYNNKLESEKQCLSQISLFLRKYCSVQSYFSDIENNIVKENIKYKNRIIQPYYELEENKLNQFCKDIFDWAKEFETNHIHIDLYYINAIFVKFLSQLSPINEDKKSYSIGHYFNRILLAFYNACIVEECLNNNQYNINISKSFYETESDILADNYQIFKNTIPHTKKTFFQWMYNCPLLRSFTSEMIRFIFMSDTSNSAIYKNIWNRHRVDFLKKQIENTRNNLYYIDNELDRRNEYENEARQTEILELRFQTSKRIFEELSKTKGNDSLLNNLDLLKGETTTEKMNILQKEINQLAERLINADKSLYEYDYGNYEERTEARKQLIRRKRILTEQKKLIEKRYPTLLTNTEQLQQDAILGGSESDNELTLKLNQYFMYRDVSDFI